MKKLISLILSLSLALSLAACTGAVPKAQPEGPAAQSAVDTTVESTAEESLLLAGGWQRPASPVVTPEQKAVLDKALEELTGAEYEPLACLGTQVVAGMNYRFLCKVTPVVPDTVSNYAVVTVYEDLEGNAELTEVLESGDEAPQEQLDGGWTIPDSPELTEEARAALEKATETLTGATYTPAALVATQVVAGTNYCILCEQTPSVPQAEQGYVLLLVYEDLEGNAEITETVEFQGMDAEG